MDNAEPEFYWVAICGARVPSCAFPVTLSRMQRATVVVGNSSADQTIWDIDGATPLTSNYDFLIGYRAPQAQAAAVRTFLDAPIETARAELRRALRHETVISRSGAHA
jgi:hypothetical protein